MTLPVQIVRYVYSGPYSVGDTIPIPFTYMETDHVWLYKNKDKLRFNIDYSVSGQNITINVTAKSTDRIVVYRQTPLNNDAEFPQEAEFDSEKINDAIDKLTMQNQEQQEQIDRALKLPIDSSTGLIVGLPTPDPYKCLKWNAAGTSLINSTYDPDSQVSNAAYWAAQAEASANRAAGYVTQIEDLIANFKAIMDQHIEDIVDQKLQEYMSSLKLLPITQEAYNALETKDENTLYIIDNA